MRLPRSRREANRYGAHRSNANLRLFGILLTGPAVVGFFALINLCAQTAFVGLMASRHRAIAARRWRFRLFLAMRAPVKEQLRTVLSFQ